jgi:hypothetical protein
MKETVREQPKTPALGAPLRKIVVRRTEPIKVTSAPANHQPLPIP